MRTLRPEEIECRVGQQTKDKSKYSVLLYKTARTDRVLLNEEFGLFGWMARHYEVKGKDFCEISVKNPETGEWIAKSDCGSESNIEAEKGEASDALKRAGFMWGIGEELYTAPKIWLSADIDSYSLEVSYIKYDDSKKIVALEIVGKEGQNKTKTTVYKMGSVPTQSSSENQNSHTNDNSFMPVAEKNKVKEIEEKLSLFKRLKELKVDEKALLGYYKVNSINEMSVAQLRNAVVEKENKNKKASA